MKRLILILLLVLASSACDPPVEPWAATVNGEVITADTVINEVDTVLADPKLVTAENLALGGSFLDNRLQPNGSNTVNASFTSERVLTGRVLDVLIAQELRRLNLTINDQQRQRAIEVTKEGFTDPTAYDSLAGDYRDYLLRRYAGVLALVDAANTPDKQLTYYNEHRSDFVSVCLRHIMVLTPEQADDVRNRVIAGQDFAAIARAESLDNDPNQGTAAKGGEIGCLGLDELNANFRSVVAALAEGQLSEPIQSSSGFHIVQVTTRKALTLEEAQTQISKAIADPAKIVDELLAKADISVNPRFGVYTPADKEAGTTASITPFSPTVPADDNEEPQTDESPFVNPFLG